MKDPLNEIINYFKDKPIYLVVILLIIIFFYLISRIKKDKVIKNDRCPMCGGNLVNDDSMVRCINYPKCRYRR